MPFRGQTKHEVLQPCGLTIPGSGPPLLGVMGPAPILHDQGPSTQISTEPHPEQHPPRLLLKPVLLTSHIRSLRTL